MTVEEMLNRISSSELVYWQALFLLEQEDEKFASNKAEMMRKLNKGGW